MSPPPLAKMVFDHPLPAFSSPGEIAQVSIYGRNFVFRTTPLVEHSQRFNKFADFPKEIQTKIWGFADAGRTITAVEVTKHLPNNTIEAHQVNAALALIDNADSGSDAEAEDEDNNGMDAKDFENAFRFTGAGYPTIFQVCKEVQQLAAAMGYAPMFRVHGSSKAVYFNPKVDTLHLRNRLVRNNIYNQVPLAKALVNKSELKLIRYFHLSLSYFMVHSKSALKDIHSMVSLQELTLYGSCDVRPTSPEFTLKLKYQYDALRVRAVTVADIPGNPLTDKNLGEAIRYWIPDTEDQDKLKDIYGQINDKMYDCVLHPNTKSFPLLVKTNLAYIASI